MSFQHFENEPHLDCSTKPRKGSESISSMNVCLLFKKKEKKNLEAQLWLAKAILLKRCECRSHGCRNERRRPRVKKASSVPWPTSHSPCCHVRSNAWPSLKLGVNAFSFLPALCSCSFSLLQIFRFPSDPAIPSFSHLQMTCSVLEKSKHEVIHWVAWSHVP